MIRIAIVEDEVIYKQQLKKYLERYQKESGSRIEIAMYSDGEDIMDDYNGNYDIILMDIQMRFMDGMTTAEKIRQLDSEVIIIFITNMTQYALRGYEVDALDYVVKPVEYFAFSQKLDRAITRMKKRSQQCITIPVEKGIQKLDISEIYFIESQGHALIYNTRRGKFISRGTVSEVEVMTKDYGFFRCSKGFLVNMQHVEGVKGGYCIVNGQEIPISRAKKKQFMEILLQFISEVMK